MKKRFISVVIIGGMALTMIKPIPVIATPNQHEITDARNQYEKLENNLSNIQTKIDELNLKIEPLVNKLEENKQEMEKNKNEICMIEKEVEKTKVLIKENEEILGGRLRELYKSGGQNSYISVIFSAQSFSDLVSRLDATNRLVNIDKNVIQEVKSYKDNLYKKIELLKEKKKRIEKLNRDTEKELVEFEKLEQEQLQLSNQAKKERDKFNEEHLSKIEGEIVKEQVTLLNNEDSSIDQLKSAMKQAESLRDSQIKSQTVKSRLDESIQKGKQSISKKEEKIKFKEVLNRGNEISGTQMQSGNSGSIIGEAYNHLGTPYVWGATGPSSFDCSGFTSYVYRKAAGVEITRTTGSQIGVGKSVSKNELKNGDLVFTSPGHVGIYVGGGNIIHAPQTGDVVKVSPIWNFYAARRIVN